MECNVEKLIALKELLSKAGWEPKTLPITPLEPAERETVLHRLQSAYLQHRMLRSRGDL
jgi:hypothetical protein